MGDDNFKVLVDIVLGITIIMGILLGLEIRYEYFAISIASIGILYYLNKRKKEKERLVFLKTIREKWGSEHIEKRDFSNIEKLYRYQVKKKAVEFTIDDITWRDLNMGEVFKKIDHTNSLPGMQFLYNILRKPLYNKDILENRNKTVSYYLSREKLAQDIQFPLAILGKEDGSDIFDYFENGVGIDTNKSRLYTILSYIPYGVVVLFFIKPSIAFILLLILIAINNTVYQKNKKKVYKEMEIFKYLGSLISCAEKIIKIRSDDLQIRKSKIEAILKDIKSLKRNISKINFNETFLSEAEIIVHYYNMLMLKEPKVFYKAVGQMNKFRGEIFNLYKLIGEIDAYIAIASYKSSLKYYSTPTLENKEKTYIDTKELYHPLLLDPVSYSFILNDKGALVTGSNASGKSTFLRAIGINSIFAQTMYFTLSNSYTSSYFKLLTSIGTTDSIIKGDSYFMSEAKSLKRIINAIDGKYPVLCILDEIFRGTNTTERINMALEVLNYMINRNSCVIAATHDLELTNLVNDKFCNYHFRETIEDKDIKFDYQLRIGPSTTRNAIAILRYLDYPKEIYENAEISTRKQL